MIVCHKSMQGLIIIIRPYILTQDILFVCHDCVVESSLTERVGQQPCGPRGAKSFLVSMMIAAFWSLENQTIDNRGEASS